METTSAPVCEYRGLCATTYDLLLPADEVDDESFFRDVIAQAGEPALEIGCGTGRLLLAYRRADLDVEGLDVSREMLDICRRKAAAAGLDVSLHEQAVESLDLDRRFRSIYVPVCSFMLIVTPLAARAALDRIRRHLEPDGRLIITLGLPWKADVATDPAPAGEWRLRRDAVRPADDAQVRCWELATYDFDAQIKHAQLRYEVDAPGRPLEAETHVLPLRWYSQAQFSSLLRDAGFTDICAVREHTWEPAHEQDPFFTFVARVSSQPRSPASNWR